MVSSKGMRWRIVTKTYARPSTDGIETHWISLSLVRPGTGTEETFFKYQYGDTHARYWVYALRVCDINVDGREDLMFYAGDDTTDVTVEFTNTGATLTETKRFTTDGE